MVLFWVSRTLGTHDSCLFTVATCHFSNSHIHAGGGVIMDATQLVWGGLGGVITFLALPHM